MTSRKEYTALDAVEIDLLLRGEKLNAIRAYRNRNGVLLTEAKHAVEAAMLSELPKSPRTSKYEWHVVPGKYSDFKTEIFDNAEDAADRLQEVWTSVDTDAYIIPVTPAE